jgi:Flp pilus assembly pilin Flp
MSDLTLNAVTSFQVNKRVARQAVVNGVRRTAGRVADRFRREQTGQDVLEYSGMVVLIAGIIVLFFGMGLQNIIASAVVNAVNSIFTSNHTYTAPKAITVPQGG